MSDDLVKILRADDGDWRTDQAADRIEELEAENKRLRLEAAHANDTADAAIERAKELEAALSEQIEWVKRLADDMNAAEGREARLKANLAKAVDALDEAVYLLAPDDKDMARKAGVYRIVTTLAELKGQDDD